MGSLKNRRFFQENMCRNGETIVDAIEGSCGPFFGSGPEKPINGTLLLTNHRVCFVKVSIFGKTIREFPLHEVEDSKAGAWFIFLGRIWSPSNSAFVFRSECVRARCEDFLAASKEECDLNLEVLSVRRRANLDSQTHVKVKNSASKRVQNLLRIHTDINLEEIPDLDQDGAWSLLREKSSSWYRSGERVAVYGFSRDDLGCLKEELEEFDIQIVRTLTRRATCLVIADDLPLLEEMTESQQEKYNALLDEAETQKIPVIDEVDFLDIVNRMRRKPLLSDHFDKME